MKSRCLICFNLLSEASHLRDEDYQSKNRGQRVDGGLQVVSNSCNGISPASPVKRLKRFCSCTMETKIFLWFQFAFCRVMTSLGTSYSLPIAPSEAGDQVLFPVPSENPSAFKIKFHKTPTGGVTVLRNFFVKR